MPQTGPSLPEEASVLGHQDAARLAASAAWTASEGGGKAGNIEPENLAERRKARHRRLLTPAPVVPEVGVRSMRRW